MESKEAPRLVTSTIILRGVDNFSRPDLPNKEGFSDSIVYTWPKTDGKGPSLKVFGKGPYTLHLTGVKSSAHFNNLVTQLGPRGEIVVEFAMRIYAFQLPIRVSRMSLAIELSEMRNKDESDYIPASWVLEANYNGLPIYKVLNDITKSKVTFMVFHSGKCLMSVPDIGDPPKLYREFISTLDRIKDRIEAPKG